jgi:hypothetical protein
MTRLNVWEFCSLGYKTKEIRIHAITHNLETGEETFIHKIFHDKFDHELFRYQDYEVIQYNIIKRGCIDIIAYREIEK